MCDKINTMLMDNDFTVIDKSVAAPVNSGSTSDASRGEEFRGTSSGSAAVTDLPPLPRLPIPVMAGRALLASSNALRRFQEQQVGRPPVPTSEDVADASGVFNVVGGLRWVPVYALVTQG